MDKLINQMKEPNTKVFLLIFVLGFLVFFPVLQNGFLLWDDTSHILENPNIQNLSFKGLKAIFFESYAGTYFPLYFLTLAFDRLIFGDHPFGFHLTSLLLHLLNSALAYLFLFKILRKREGAFIGALLFLIHPVHVEPVAWLSSRKELLYATFFLISCLYYFAYLESKRKNKGHFYKCFSFFILSLFSKTTAVVLPLILLLFDFFHEKKIQHRLKEKIPFFISSILFSIITVLSQQPAIREGAYSLYQNFQNASFGFFFYWTKILFPINLSCLYPYPDDFLAIFPYGFHFLALGFILFLVFLVKKRNRFPKFFFGLSFFIILLLPVIQLIPFGGAIASDRYLYLPLLGLCYLVGERSVFFSQNKKWRQPLVFFGIFIFLLLSFFSFNRAKIWRNDIILWSNFLEQYPKVAKGYINRGAGYLSENNFEAAEKDFKKAYALDPEDAFASLNLGLTYSKTGKYQEAISHFSEGIRLRPNDSKAYFHRGVTFERLGRLKKAKKDLIKSLELDPNNLKAKQYFKNLHNEFSKRFKNLK